MTAAIHTKLSSEEIRAQFRTTALVHVRKGFAGTLWAPAVHATRRRKLRTALDLFNEYQGVATGLAEVDVALNGGVPSGFVVEVGGGAGCGKSRLLSLIAGYHAANQALISLEVSTIGEPPLLPSVLYLQCDYHFSHAARSIHDAIVYHSTALWERSAHGKYHVESYTSQQAYVDVDLIVSKALQGVTLVDVRGELDAGAVPNPLQSVVDTVRAQLSGDLGGRSRAPTVVVIDSVSALVKHQFSGMKSGDRSRHDALATFLQTLKDAATAYGAVIFISNHVVADRTDTREEADEYDEDETGEVLGGGPTIGGVGMHQRGGGAVKGAFGTTFYHAVNIRLRLSPLNVLQQPSEGGAVTNRHAVLLDNPISLLHITKSPICPPQSFTVSGLLSELRCYEGVAGGGHRLKPSVHAGKYV